MAVMVLLLHGGRFLSAQPFGVDLLSAQKGAVDLAPSENGQLLYLLNPGEGRLFEVDALSGRLLTSHFLGPLVPNPIALTCTRKKVYLLGPEGIAVYLPDRRKLSLTLRLFSGNGPNRGEIRKGRDGLLYCIHYNSSALFIIDPVQDKVVEKIHVGTSHTDVAADPSCTLAVLHQEQYYSDSRVTYVDLSFRRVLRTVPYHPPTLTRSATPPQITAGPRGVYVGYAENGASRILVAHLDHSGHLVRTLEGICFCDRPSGLEITPDEEYLLAGGNTVFDLGTGQVVHCVSTPGGLHRAARSADGKNIYFTNASSLVVTRFTRDPPPIRITGTPAPGNTLTVHLDQLRASNLYYQLGASFGTSPGIEISGNRIIPLRWDGLLWIALFTGNDLLFRDACNRLDGYGHGISTMIIPDIHGLAGLKFYLAFWTYVDTKLFEVFTLTEKALEVDILAGLR